MSGAKKRRTQPSSRQPASRNLQDALPAFGAPSEADKTLGPSASSITANALSTRYIRPSTLPSLVFLAAKVFAEHIIELYEDPTKMAATRAWLDALPDTLRARVWTMLKERHPTKLPSAFIAMHFLSGDIISLSGELTGVNTHTIEATGKAGELLRHLHLTGLERIADSAFAHALAHLPNLEDLNLRGSTKVGAKTVTAAARRCPRLKSVNLNYTTPTLASVIELVCTHPDLEVLKLASVPNITDVAFAKVLPELQATRPPPLLKLRTLKLRYTSVTQVTLSVLLPMSPHLERLDLSFTPVKLIPAGFFSPPLQPPPLEKLSLTSCPLNAADIVPLLVHLPGLKKLHLGAMGASTTKGSVANLTLTDTVLGEMTNALTGCERLEEISLVGNAKLGLGYRGDFVADFMQRVGRNVKTLNLSALPSLRSSCLAPLLPLDEGSSPPALENLVLSNTPIDDDAVPYIACCRNLKALDIANTRFSKDGVFDIIDACELLEKMDLTSCRGIKVQDRRRFFEVWKDERG